METIIKNKIKGYEMYSWFRYLKTKRAFIAGGALTSILTNRKINDFDIYFRTKQECEDAINHFTFEEEYICVASTDNAVTFKTKAFGKEITLQLIQADSLINECIYDTINNFDFTINMAAYDLITGNIIAHANFYKDNMKRKLVFNEDTLYPIVSMHRAIKYINRGYSLSGYELVKIALLINNLKMKNYTDLKKQLQGIDTSVFQPITDKLMRDLDTEYNYKDFKEKMKDELKGE